MNETIKYSTSNLSIGYKSKNNTTIIAENLNFEFQSGKLISLIGENGIGKSTLIKTLSGIKKPISGIVSINEKNINRIDSVEMAQNISLVLTEKLPLSNLTVYELIAIGRQPYTNWLGKLTPEDISKTIEAIEMAQIQHLVNKKYFELSDGQLQIVLVARALAQDTPIIILDEPSTHLDLLHKVSLFKLLKKLTTDFNKCIIYSTHDIDLAIQLSDEMIVMSKDSVIIDQPCNLINKGVFDALFKDESIVFDKNLGKFIIK
jgi:iron complex transport system ATP-binding protein